MIAYIEKGYGMHEAIQAAGHWLAQIDGVWTSSDDAAVQAIIDAYDSLPDVKAAKIASIKLDGLARVNAIFPAVETIDEFEFYSEFWLSIKSTARSPTANFQKVIDIYTAAKDAVASVNAATTEAEVNNVTPNWPA